MICNSQRINLYDPTFSDCIPIPHHGSSSLEVLVHCHSIRKPDAMAILHIIFYHSHCVYSFSGLVFHHNYLIFPIVHPRSSQHPWLHSVPNSISNFLHLWFPLLAPYSDRAPVSWSCLLSSSLQFSDTNISTYPNSQQLNLRFLWMRNGFLDNHKNSTNHAILKIFLSVFIFFTYCLLKCL